MKLSIITVVYNNEKHIHEAIGSVLSQTYPDIEYIIIDGGSRDQTVNIINTYKDRVAQIVSEKDKGIYDAMNKGIRLAKGEVIGILNSDDLYSSNTILSEVMEVFAANPQVDALYGNIVYFHTERPDKIVRSWKSRPYFTGFFENGHVPPHPSLFVRKKVYDAIGLYHDQFKISSDYEFMLRMMKLHQYQTFFLDKVIVNMRMGGESTKSWSNILLGNKEIIASWKMNGQKMPATFFLKKFFSKAFQLIKL